MRTCISRASRLGVTSPSAHGAQRPRLTNCWPGRPSGTQCQTKRRVRAYGIGHRVGAAPAPYRLLARMAARNMDSARPSALRRCAVFTICDTREPTYSADDAQPTAVPAFLPPRRRTGSGARAAAGGGAASQPRVLRGHARRAADPGSGICATRSTQRAAASHAQPMRVDTIGCSTGCRQ